MNPYLRQDIEEQITEYWRDIHRNKWSIVSREYEDVTLNLKEHLDRPGDHIFYPDWSPILILYISFDQGRMVLRYSSPNICLLINNGNPVLQRYMVDMKTRYEYHGI